MSRLQEQVDDLHGLYEQLTSLVWEKETQNADESTHQKISHSAFPGSSRHWTWLVSVRAGTRRAEGDLEAGLQFAHVYRSDSDRNTHASLSRLPLLVEAWTGTCPRSAPESTESDEQAPSHVRHGLMCAAVGWAPHVTEAVVDRWWTTARELLDIDEPWTRVQKAQMTFCVVSDKPIRSVGHCDDHTGVCESEVRELPRCCPYCNMASLRIREHEGTMRCAYPACDDGSGKPAYWDAEAMRFLAHRPALAGEAS